MKALTPNSPVSMSSIRASVYSSVSLFACELAFLRALSMAWTYCSPFSRKQASW